MAERVAIIGTGFIGRAWVISFARAGWNISLWDAQRAAVENCLKTVASCLRTLPPKACSALRATIRCRHE